MPDADDLGMELLPADDPQLTADEELEAAVQSALAPDYPSVAGTQPIPLGRTWLFNFEEGRLERYGTTPVPVSREMSLRVWCLTAIHSARYAHSIFSDAFGVEEPEDWIGDLVTDSLLEEVQEGIRRALTVHDRVTDVTDFDIEGDPAAGSVRINGFTVEGDEDVRIELGQPFIIYSQES